MYNLYTIALAQVAVCCLMQDCYTAR